MLQKELKKEYEDQIRNYSSWRESKSMQDHCIKTSCWIVKFEDGSLISFDKPHIEKDFCFGYSLSRYNSDSYDAANEAAANARTDVDYFMRKNLENIEREIDLAKNGNVCYLDHHWYGDLDTCRIGSVQYVSDYDFHFRNDGKYIELSEEDRKRYIEGLEEVKKAFIKRLNTYLKKYGLSKVHTWSYWRDE